MRWLSYYSGDCGSVHQEVQVQSQVWGGTDLTLHCPLFFLDWWAKLADVPYFNSLFFLNGWGWGWKGGMPVFRGELFGGGGGREACQFSEENYLGVGVEGRHASFQRRIIFLILLSLEMCALNIQWQQGNIASDRARHFWGGDSSVVRVPDSWLKGRGFESLLERQDNFLLQGRLSVLTLISVSVPPPCYHSSM